MRFARNWPGRIACQEDDAPVCLGRQMEMVVHFLYLTQAEGSRCCVDRRSKGLTYRNDLGVGPSSRGTVSLEMIGMPQCKVSGSTEWQVARVQILKGTKRLGKKGVYIV